MRHTPRDVDEVAIEILTLPGTDGPFHVAATDRGVVAAGGTASREAFIDRLARRFPRMRHGSPIAGGILDSTRPILDDLAAGRPVDARAVPLDLRDRPEWDRRVLLAVREVGWGETASYGEIARRIGAPRAARAVGGAMGRNELSMLVPCHRIIAADGTIGGYGGDGPVDRAAALARKRALLLREGRAVPDRAG